MNTERPVCECGVHIVNSRTRLGQLNDPRRLEVYTRVLEASVTPDSVVLALGDGCLMAIVAAKLGSYMIITNNISIICLSVSVLYIFIMIIPYLSSA